MKYIKVDYLKIVLATIGIYLIGYIGQAQTLGDLHISPNASMDLFIAAGTDLEQALAKMEQRFDVVFLYRSDAIKNTQVTHRTILPGNAEKALATVLAGTGLEFKYLNPKTYGIYQKVETFPEILLFPAFQIAVEGTVTDVRTGESLPGVNVLVKGTSTGTSTDIDGAFELSAPTLSDTLIFSYVGYEQLDVPIAGRSELNVEMTPQTIAGDELVVTAFGISREQKSLTYSTQGVDTEQITEARELNIVQSLQGKVAGISIYDGGQGVGSASRVLLRGNRSFNSSDEPLYVVDGVPVRGGISDLSPNNIESIEVLKGPNAAALYGSAAQNGAIVVTTKTGRPGDITVSLSNNVMFTAPKILHTFQNEYGQGDGGVINRRTFSSWGPRMEGQMIDHWSPNPELSGMQIPYSPQPDNVRDFFQYGYNTSTNLTASIGGENTQALFDYTFTDAEGIVPNNSLERHNVNIRVTSHLNENLSLDSKLSFRQEETDYRIERNNRGTTYFAYRMPRSIRTVDASNYEYIDPDGNLRHNTWLPGFGRSFNPYWTANNIRQTIPEDRVIGLASLTYDFNNQLSLMVRGAYDQTNRTSEQRVYNDTGTTWGDGYYGISESKFLEFNGDFLLSHIIDLTESWNINSNIGGSIKQQRNRSLSSNTGDALTVPNFFTLSNTQNVESSFNAGSPIDILSLYGFATIGWRDAIYLDITGRNDWSSTLPSESRSFFYPSFGVSAILSDLIPAFPDVFSFAQVRGSWARVGNSPGAFNTQRFVSFITGGNNGFMRLSNSLPNESLLPEETTSYEFGMDIRFFEGRLGLDITAYHTNTRNQLFALSLPVASGAASFFTNGGDVQNQGIEALMQTTPVQTGNFNWDLDFNFAANRNEVVKISDERDLLFLPGPRSFFRQFGVKEGEPFGQIYSRGYERDDQGRVLIGNNGLPLTTSGLTVPVANPNPDWKGGVTSSFTYRNISVSFLIDHQQGGTLVSETNTLIDGEGHSMKTLQGREGGLVFGENFFAEETAVMASDGSPNTTEINAETFWSNMGGLINAIGEPFVEDATYTKFRELILGYTFPPSILNNLPISNLRISAVGRNLFFIYRASGNVDPDILSGTSKGAPGLDSFNPPNGPSFGFNVNINF